MRMMRIKLIIANYIFVFIRKISIISIKKMLAIIKTGGKQYIVKEGDILDIEKIEGEEGKKISLDNILLVNDDKNTKVGMPVVEKAKVEAEIIKQFKGKKVEIVKYKKKTGYRRKTGHRQQYTKVKIVKINF